MTSRHTLIAAALAATALAAWAAPAAAQTSVLCESEDGRYKMCKVDTRGGVRLQQQLSRGDCVYHETWGYNRSGIWVNNGCRARFEVSHPGWHDSSSGSWSGGHGTTVTCESNDNRRNHCRADTYSGVRLDHQLSRASCRYGVDWGYDDTGIWVDNGCRAEFELGHSTYGGGYSGHHSYNSHPDHSDSRGAVLCESRGYDRSYCPAFTRGGVRLEEQRSSNADCIYNRTWGYDSGGIWVSGGCRAVFRLGDQGQHHTYQSSHHSHDSGMSDAQKIGAAALVVGAIAAIAATADDERPNDRDNDDWR